MAMMMSKERRSFEASMSFSVECCICGNPMEWGYKPGVPIVIVVLPCVCTTHEVVEKLAKIGTQAHRALLEEGT